MGLKSWKVGADVRPSWQQTAWSAPTLLTSLLLRLTLWKIACPSEKSSTAKKCSSAPFCPTHCFATNACSGAKTLRKFKPRRQPPLVSPPLERATHWQGAQLYCGEMAVNSTLTL